MPATPTSPLQEKIRDFGRILRFWGYDDTDFVFECDTTSPLGELFGIAGGVLVVRRRSTGEARAYQAAADSPWFYSVLRDLAQGHLADAPETRPAALTLDDNTPSHPSGDGWDGWDSRR